VAARAASTRIPVSLAPYFQEYDLADLDISEDAHLIIGRVLEQGNRQELRWLFRSYGEARVKQFVSEYGFRALSKRSFNFWRTVLKVRKFKRPSWLPPSKSPTWRF
jgi:hypothetical protein